MFVENKTDDWSGRWSHIQKLLMRSGPLAHQDFEPGPQVNSTEVNLDPCIIFWLIIIYMYCTICPSVTGSWIYAWECKNLGYWSWRFRLWTVERSCKYWKYFVVVCFLDLYILLFWTSIIITIRPVALLEYGAIAHEVKPNGLLIWLVALEGEGSNCFSIAQLVRPKKAIINSPKKNFIWE